MKWFRYFLEFVGALIAIFFGFLAIGLFSQWVDDHNATSAVIIGVFLLAASTWCVWMVNHDD